MSSSDNLMPGHDTLNSDEHTSPLRKRILQESASEAQRYRRKPQQKRFRAPDFPGAAAFDLKNDLRQMPEAKPRRCCPPHSTSKIVESEGIPLADHHAEVLEELDKIEEASNTKQPVPARVALTHRDRGGYLTPSSSALIRKPYQLKAQDLCGPASCEKPPSQAQGAPESDVLLKQPPTRPITEQQLINEVKGIYAGLVMVERKCADVRNQALRTCVWLSGHQWKNLVALQWALIRERLDFFSATQHPLAPLPLKQLARKYAMTAHMWRQEMNTLEILRQRHPNASYFMEYGDLLAETIKDLTINVPQLSDQWDLVKENLREYFIALKSDGTDVPSSLIERLETKETMWTQIRKTLCPPMRGHFFGDDDDLPEDWYLPFHPHDQSGPPLGEDWEDAHFGREGLLGTAQLVMAGWLQYGRKIATSYHAYCQVFIFLAILAFTASLNA